MSREVDPRELAAAEPLPDVLDQVAQACGYPVALQLAQAYGGRELFVPLPGSIGEQHPLALIFGVATARRLANVLGHHKLLIPLGPASTRAKRRAALREMKRRGCTNPQIARELGIHLRWVEKLSAMEKLGPDPRQRGLFDD